MTSTRSFTEESATEARYTATPGRYVRTEGAVHRDLDLVRRTRKKTDPSSHDAGRCEGIDRCIICLAEFATDSRLTIEENQRVLGSNNKLIQDLQRNIQAVEKQAKTLLPAWKLLCLMIISIATLQIIGDLAQLLPN